MKKRKISKTRFIVGTTLITMGAAGAALGICMSLRGFDII